jgi:uncharacterized protein YceH (UPF0502 family)
MIGLSFLEGRVLGCLIEKERTVADQYPLTLNALVAACNQTTSRHPVIQASAEEIEAAAGSLKAHGLVRLVHPSHGRAVVRYRQVFIDKLGLDEAEAAVIGVLLLRGALTAAEIRTHGQRWHHFERVEDVDGALDALADRGEPLVERLDRRSGRAGERWVQSVTVAIPRDEPAPIPTGPGPAQQVVELEQRVIDLEARLARLEDRLSDLLS